MKRALPVTILGAMALIPESTMAAPAPGAPSSLPAPPPGQPAAPAQAKPPPQNALPAAQVQSVTVVGQSATSVQIDRRSYSVANDLRAGSGSIADVLRSVPTVQVDPQGNLTLRGDPSVSVLVDGQPAPQFQGPGRLDALRSLPANSVDKIEVMTNPSAEITADGTGGVINIVMKQARGTDPAATLGGAFGTEGRAQATFSGSAALGRLSGSADASFRADPRPLHYATTTEGIVLGGQKRMSRNINDSTGEAYNAAIGIRAEYLIDPRTRLTGQARFNQTTLENFGTVSSFVGPDGGALALNYLSTNNRKSRFNQTTANAGLRRTFPGDRHELTMDYQYTGSTRESVVRTAPIGGISPIVGVYEDITVRTPLSQDVVKLAYRRPMPHAGRLVVGYDRISSSNRNNVAGLVGDTPRTVHSIPTLVDHFRQHEVQQSLYTTYQQPFGKVNVLAGLRVDRMEVSLGSPALSGPLDLERTLLIPSLNLNWKPSDKSRYSASYSRRIERPLATDYNPNLNYLDYETFRQGDPYIRPAKSDAFELSYEYRNDGFSYLATMFYKANHGVITNFVYPLSDGVFVNRRGNAIEAHYFGVELVSDGRLSSKLRYNASATISRGELQSLVGADRKSWMVSGNGGLDWSPTSIDLFQLNFVAVGRFLLPQGHVRPMHAVNFGYRRKLSERLFFFATADDVFGSFGTQTLVLESPHLNNRVSYRSSAVRASFRYTLGGPRTQAAAVPRIQFGTGGSSPDD